MIRTIYTLMVQLPPGTQNPDDNSPIDFSSPFDVIVFVILPIVVVVGYIIWRKNKHRKNE